MSSHTFTTYIEIPVEITFDYDPPQREITAPNEAAQAGTAAQVNLLSVRVRGYADKTNLPAHIDICDELSTNEDSAAYDAVIDACWDHMEKVNDQP